MNATYSVMSYVITDDILTIMGHQEDCRARVSSAEIVTVAIVAAKYFQNHHECALCMLQQTGYLPTHPEWVALQSPLACLTGHLTAYR